MVIIYPATHTARSLLSARALRYAPKNLNMPQFRCLAAAALDEEAPDVLPRSEISSLTTPTFVGGVRCVLRRYLFVCRRESQARALEQKG
jgi:hypothetical protein